MQALVGEAGQVAAHVEAHVVHLAGGERGGEVAARAVQARLRAGSARAARRARASARPSGRARRESAGRGRTGWPRAEAGRRRATARPGRCAIAAAARPRHRRWRSARRRTRPRSPAAARRRAARSIFQVALAAKRSNGITGSSNTPGSSMLPPSSARRAVPPRSVASTRDVGVAPARAAAARALGNRAGGHREAGDGRVDAVQRRRGERARPARVELVHDALGLVVGQPLLRDRRQRQRGGEAAHQRQVEVVGRELRRRSRARGRPTAPCRTDVDAGADGRQRVAARPRPAPSRGCS